MVYKTSSSSPAAPVPDDAFAILRDCRTFYLKQLGQLLQEAEPVSAKAVEVFRQAVGGYFDEMVAGARRSGFEGAKGLTASRISLVKEHDLELDIRLGEFSSRLMDATGGDLWRVYLRFVTLLGRPELSTADNPVGSKGIALGLADFCDELGENHDQSLDRIDRLESYFARNLNVLYASLNDFLGQRNVAAAQPAMVTAPDNTPPQPAANQAPNPAMLLQQRLSAAVAPATPSLPGGGNEAAVGLLSQATLERLLFRLDELERAAQLGAAAPLAGASTNSLEALIPGLFERDQPPPPAAMPKTVDSRQLGLPSSAPEAATIDTLAQIFEVIFASPNFPDAVKSAISSLQIPMLKAAMRDGEFFRTENHPARRLLDRMARAALGLPRDVAPDHPVCATLQAIAARVRSESARDQGVFAQGLAELDALIERRDQAVAQAAEAYLPLLYQLDRRKKGAARSRQFIDGIIARGIPASVASFLSEHWYKVLLISWMEGGEQGPAWQENTSLIGDLLWSIQAKTELDDRKRLAKMLPVMLQRLNAGMARAAIAPETQSAFLDTCFALQTAAMRGNATPAENIVPTMLSPTRSGETTLGELSAGPLLLKTLDLPENTAQSFRLRPPPVRPGSWLTFPLGDTPPLCGRLCQISPDSGMLLIANTEWQHAVAVHPGIIDSLLKSGAARVSSDDSLFNQAAEQALRGAAKP